MGTNTLTCGTAWRLWSLIRSAWRSWEWQHFLRDFGQWNPVQSLIARETGPFGQFPEINLCEAFAIGEASKRAQNLHWIRVRQSLYRVAFIRSQRRLCGLDFSLTDHFRVIAWCGPDDVSLRPRQTRKYVWQTQDSESRSRPRRKSTRKYPQWPSKRWMDLPVELPSGCLLAQNPRKNPRTTRWIRNQPELPSLVNLDA